MNHTTFQKIAAEVINQFWPLLYKHLDDAETQYLRTTPAVRRNAERRVYLALAQSFQTVRQIDSTPGTKLEDADHDETTGPTTQTPTRKPIPSPQRTHRKDPHP